MIRLETFSLPTGYDKLLTRVTRKDHSHCLASRGNSRETVGGSGPLRPMSGATCTSSNNCFTPTYVRDNVTSHVQGWGEKPSSSQGPEVHARIRQPPRPSAPLVFFHRLVGCADQVRQSVGVSHLGSGKTKEQPTSLPLLLAHSGWLLVVICFGPHGLTPFL